MPDHHGLFIWYERKFIADLQNRIGPNRAGPWGMLQTLADGIKLIFKEDLRPDGADSLVFRLAPYLSVVPAFLTFTIVPIGGLFKDGRCKTRGSPRPGPGCRMSSPRHPPKAQDPAWSAT